jgi:hypothetical protein
MAMVGGRPKAQAAMGKAEAGAGMVGGGEAIWPVQQCCEAPGHRSVMGGCVFKGLLWWHGA